MLHQYQEVTFEQLLKKFCKSSQNKKGNVICFENLSTLLNKEIYYYIYFGGSL